MKYVRNAWYVAGWSDELEPQKPFHVDILDEPIVIYRSENDKLVALEDRCVHRLAPLSLGRCEGDNIRCMYHGLLFNPEGKVSEIPGQEVIPAKARVKSYPIVDKHCWLWVWMGDADAADESLIPPAVGHDDPNWILGHGTMDYQAEAQLLNDNLLDFSHVPFVHADSFGSEDDYLTKPPKITQLERGVRFDRWITNTGGSNVSKIETLVDNWSSYDYLIPGILIRHSGHFPAGTAEACNFEKPDMDKAIAGVTSSSQAVTPITEKESRYFFNFGTRRDQGDQATCDRMTALAVEAFAEDKVMIEAQQKNIDATSDPRVTPIAHDRGIALFNRLVDNLIKEEGSDAPQEK